MISIDLYGEPTPMNRPRFARTKKSFVCYDNQSKIKEGFKWQIKSQYRESPLICPVVIDVSFYMPIPKSTPKRILNHMQLGQYHHIKKPDIDNLQKFLLDCLNGILFVDDSQVIEIRARKIYSSKVGTFIRVMPQQEIIAHERDHANSS